MSRKVLLLLVLVLISFTKLNIAEATGDTTHTVTFIDFDGDVLRVQEVPHGGDATWFEPTRIGYNFVEWDGSLIEVTEDRVVQAVYTPRIYDISLRNLDGAIIVTAKLPHDSTVEALTEQVRTAFNVGVEEYPRTEDNIFEVENFQRLWVGDNVVWHLVNTNQKQTITEYIVESEGFELIGWDPVIGTVIKGAMDFNAQYQEETDDNVIVNPEDPEEEIIEFTLQDLDLVSGDLLEASVTTEFFISLVDSLVNTLDESVLEFPELTPTSEDGIVVIIPKAALVYAEDYDIDILVQSEGYEVLIPSTSLSRVLDSIVTELRVEIKETNEVIRASYDLVDYNGTPYETMEINLLGSLSPITDYVIEVTTDTDHELVQLLNETYTLLESTVVGDGRVVEVMNNGVLIKSNLTEKEDTTTPVNPPITPEPRFDPIEWLKEADKSMLALYALGSFVVVYAAVYAFEFYRGKN